MSENSERTCIATRQHMPVEAMVRFVMGPDGTVVPDLKQSLPGRGCWVSAERRHIEKAAVQNLFRRALKDDVSIPPDLASMVDRLLARAALGSLGLCRKAGSVVLGAAKVEGSIRKGKALCILHAVEASSDGLRKLAQARRAVVYGGGPDILAYKLFAEVEMGLAFGAANVIHAGVLASNAGESVLRRVLALARYRGCSPVDRNSDAVTAAGEM